MEGWLWFFGKNTKGKPPRKRVRSLSNTGVTPDTIRQPADTPDWTRSSQIVKAYQSDGYLTVPKVNGSPVECGARSLEEPHSRVGSPKRIRSVVFCTSKGYESAEWALLSGHNNLAQLRAFLLKQKRPWCQSHSCY